MASSIGDAVRPSNDDFEATFKRGYQIWSKLDSLARQNGHGQAILQGLRSIDNAIPNYPRLPVDLATSSPIPGHALARGTFTWGLIPRDSEAQDLTPDMRLQMAFPSPVTVQCASADGEGTAEVSSGKTHQLEYLVAAWAYLLSARWAELLPESARINYITRDDEIGQVREDTSQAEEALKGSANVDDEARYWWQRISMTGSGWEARLAGDGDNVMYSPWAVKLVKGGAFERRRSAAEEITAVAPYAASFEEALGYLESYANQHCAHDQSRAALAAALFLTVARYDQRDLRLANVNLFEAGTEPTVETLPFTPTTALIDRLLLLSCNAFGMEALLHSTFYDPGLECNLVGAWTQGLMRSHKAYDASAQLAILTLRDPDLAFLWAGAYLTGAAQTCFQQVCRGLWKVDLNVGGLTGTLMSFVQEDADIETTASFLSKANECRLRHLCQGGLGAPNFAFAPFGSTAVADLDLSVRLRLSACASASTRLKQASWDTELGKTTLSLDPPPLRSKGPDAEATNEITASPSTEERKAADQCSKNVTRVAFRWLREGPAMGGRLNEAETLVCVEGGVSWSSNEREIFEHEWLRSP